MSIAMTVFNRIVVAIVALFVLAGAVITVLVATGAISPDILPYQWFESPLQRAADATGGSMAAVLAVSVVVGLGMVGILLLEFVPYRGTEAAVLLRSNGAGAISIDRDSIRLLADRAAVRAQNVRDATCTVAEQEEGLFVHCRASVALESDIPQVSVDVQSKIKEAVEQSTGLSVAQVNVKARYEKLGAKRVGASRAR